MRIDLKDVFQAHQSNGTVTIEYLTLMYFGYVRPLSRRGQFLCASGLTL